MVSGIGCEVPTVMPSFCFVFFHIIHFLLFFQAAGIAINLTTSVSPGQADLTTVTSLSHQHDDSPLVDPSSVVETGNNCLLLCLLHYYWILVVMPILLQHL